MYLKGVGQLEDYAYNGELASYPPGSEMVEYQEQFPTAGGSGPSILDQIVDFGKKLIPVALSYEQQKQLNDLNIARASKGLPPLNTSQYSAQSAPQVRVGVTPDTQKMLIYGGAALALAWAGSQFFASRRAR